jgi:antitoxin CptB
MNDQYAKLRWQCRRGMLELDILLQNFLEKKYPTLTDQEKILFEQLLACEDQDLYDWLVKKEEPNNKMLIKIINKII